MRREIALALILALASHRLTGEEGRLESHQQVIDWPAGRALAGPLPRPLFLAEVGQSNENYQTDDQTLYYVFDPARPEAGLQKVFEAPGADQYCRFLTPLFGGCGVAMGEVEAGRKKSGGPRRLFWFDLLGGKPGETIAVKPWGNGLRGRS
ncbi:MAG: hypothetical protein HY717_03065 [Planctomycetes bacterium]|nr:hypothetical protein [Planctomycetota bacterium]